MKKILKKYSLAATLMAILCLLPASCITDDAPAATEKATVTMTFTTRAETDDISPMAPANNKADAIMRSFNTGMAIFDGVMLGVKVMRKVRTYFRNLR